MAEEPTTEPRDPVTAVLADMWVRRRPEVMSDLDALTALLRELLSDPTNRELRDRATAVAHQVHGALGVFGFTAAKDRLTEVETALRDHSEITTTMIASVEVARRALPR